MGQAVTTAKFYCHGRHHFTRTGYVEAVARTTPVTNLTGVAAVTSQKERFESLQSADLRGKIFLVTGGNSGCGKEICRYLLQHNAKVYMVCRDKARAEAACDEIVVSILSQSDNSSDISTTNSTISSSCHGVDDVRNNPNASDTTVTGHQICGESPETCRRNDGEKKKQLKDNLQIIPDTDVSNASDVINGWESFIGKTKGVVDGVICNAGLLLNDLNFTDDGYEVTLASHLVFGSYLLGLLALPHLEQRKGRLIFVSSGGMLNAKCPDFGSNEFCPVRYDNIDSLDMKKLNRKYDGQLQYAYAKRGQVLLAERWAEEMEAKNSGVQILSCHPGWTETPGVDKAYSSWQKSFLQPLRSVWEGVAGICWLLTADAKELDNGAFYLDCAPTKKNLRKVTQNTKEEIDMLMQYLEGFVRDYQTQIQLNKKVVEHFLSNVSPPPSE